MNDLLEELKERWVLKQLQHKYEQHGDELLSNKFEIHLLVKKLKRLKK